MIDCAVYGDPEQCRAAAAELDRQAGQISRAEAELTYALARGRQVWSGEAARLFVVFATGASDTAVELRRESYEFSAALNRFAEALDGVRHTMKETLDLARAHNLIVTRDEIHENAGPPAAFLAPAGSSFIPPQAPYEVCRAHAELARDVERQAHEALQDAAERVRREDFLQHWLTKAGLLPTSTTAAGMSLWAGGAVLLAAGTAADWATRVRYGGLMPRIGGQRILADALSFRQTVQHGLRPSNWNHLAGQSAPYARWTTTGKVLGVAGAMLSGGTAAWSQWQADSDDPTIEDSERLARSASVGLATGAGAYGGALVGGQVGAAIGTAICPGVGTVVGGAIGGTLGGLAGSEFGEWAGGELKGFAGDGVDKIADGIKKVKFW